MWKNFQNCPSKKNARTKEIKGANAAKGTGKAKQEEKRTPQNGIYMFQTCYLPKGTYLVRAQMSLTPFNERTWLNVAYIFPGPPLTRGRDVAPTAHETPMYCAKATGTLPSTLWRWLWAVGFLFMSAWRLPSSEVSPASLILRVAAAWKTDAYSIGERPFSARKWNPLVLDIDCREAKPSKSHVPLPWA